MQQETQYNGDGDVTSSSTETERHPERTYTWTVKCAISWHMGSEYARQWINDDIQECDTNERYVRPESTEKIFWHDESQCFAT